MKRMLLLLVGCFAAFSLFSQPWEQDNSLFNPSGIPSLSFSQPRFADVDGDGKTDFWLGNTLRSPVFIRNTGSSTVPDFEIGADYLQSISGLASELAISVDLDGDGDLDLVTGGYTGLHYFVNSGTPGNPSFNEVPGFFSSLSLGSYPVPDLADIDNDGDYDLLIGLSEDGGVLLFTNTGTSLNATFSMASQLSLGDVGLYAYPVFCDLDLDGDQDVLCGRDGQGFIFFQNNGTAANPLWQENSSLFSGLGMGTYWNSPDLADLNGDSKLDLLYGTASGPLKYYLNTGTNAAPVWQEDSTLFGGVIDLGGASSPFLYDWDGDGDFDLLSGTQLGDIKFLRNTGDAYSPAWQQDNAYFSIIDHSIYAAATCGDVSGDGLPEVIVGDLNGHLYYYRNTGIGLQLMPLMFGNIALGGWSVPRLVDLDSDGDLDLAVGNEAGNLFYYENQGSPPQANWVLVPNYFGTIDVSSDCSMSFGDLDEDGDLDFVAGDAWGDLHCYLKDGFGWTANNTIFAGISTDQNAAPALVDIDHDGDLDLVLGDYDGTFSFYRNLRYSGAVLNPPTNLTYDNVGGIMLSWEGPNDGSTSPFEYYRVYLDGSTTAITQDAYWLFDSLPLGEHTLGVSAKYIAGESVIQSVLVNVVGLDEQIVQPELSGFYPNPSHGLSHLRYSVKSPSKLEIFNLKGQKVMAYQLSGSGEIEFAGHDQRGKRLPAGVYFYRIDDGTTQKIDKLLLLR